MRHATSTAFVLTLALLVGLAPAAGQVDPSKNLVMAVIFDDRDAVARLVADGVDVDAAGTMGTALMFAALNGDAELVSLLLEAGASPDLDVGARNPFGPAINWAAKGGAAAVVDALLAGGADPTVVTHHGDALAIAMRLGFPEIVASLVAATGADTGDGPLHAAARADDAAELERLLAAGSAVDAENRVGYTPLMEAAREGHAGVVARLLAAGADPAHRGNALGMGMTALHLAALRDRSDVARLLLEHGVAVDAGNAEGTTPLVFALGEGSLATAWVLLDGGADPAIENDTGLSALAVAGFLSDERLVARIREAAGAERESAP